MIVAVKPLLMPLRPKPPDFMIFLVTNQVLGTSLPFAMFDCNDTFTTSNGLTKIDSVIPAQRPAKENVYKYNSFKESAYTERNSSISLLPKVLPQANQT